MLVCFYVLLRFELRNQSHTILFNPFLSLVSSPLLPKMHSDQVDSGGRKGWQHRGQARNRQQQSRIRQRMSISSLLSSDPAEQKQRRRLRRRNERTGERSRSGPKAPRGSCGQYTEEQQIAIWYLRKDLGLDWTVVAREYSRIFDSHQKRTMEALRCRFYRVLTDWGVAKVRKQFQCRSSRGSSAGSELDTAEYGVLVRVSTVFPISSN